MYGSRQESSNDEYLVTKIGFDTAENEPSTFSKICKHLTNLKFRSEKKHFSIFGFWKVAVAGPFCLKKGKKAGGRSTSRRRTSAGRDAALAAAERALALRKEALVSEIARSSRPR